MGTLTSCIAKAGKALHKEDKAALLRYASELRSEGVENSEAAIRASERLLEELKAAHSAEAAALPAAPSLDMRKALRMAIQGESDPATHTDPGEAPELATPAVVKESLTVAASNEGRKPSAMKAELLAWIDADLKDAPDYPQFLESVKLMGKKDAVAAWTAKSGLQMGERYAPADYSRPVVTFNVKGDGKFTVNNTTRSLLTFRKAVEASGGFKDKKGKPAPDRIDGHGIRYGVEAGSGSNKSAFANMVDEGDLEAASDYADAVGLELSAKNPNDAKVLAWREKRDAMAEVQAINAAWGDEQKAATQKAVDKASEAAQQDDALAEKHPPGRLNDALGIKASEVPSDDQSKPAGKPESNSDAKEVAGGQAGGGAQVLSDGEVRTEDGKVFKPSENKLVGSAPSVRSREINKPAKVGEYPVFVEQGGSYRMFTYSKKIAELGKSVQQSPVGVQYSNPPIEQSASERPDLGKQWDALDQDGRHTVAALAGWAASSGKVNPQGKAISRKTWADQIETTRARLASALKKGKEPSRANVKPAADRLEQEAQLWAKLTDGAATVAEFKAGFEAWVRDKTAIIEQFNRLTKAQLLAMGGGQFTYRYKTGNKPEIAAALWADGLAQYGLGRTISYSMGAGRNGYQDAVAKMVDVASDERLKTYAEERKQAMKEAGERAAKVAEATQDPKTLDDFHIFLRAAMRDGKTFKDARLGMTPEQRAKFDELSAESTREQREARKRAIKTELKTSSEAVGGQVIETTHTQKGHALFVVQLEKRIDRADYDRINASAKKLGGFYSSFRGRGAVPGFQFRDRASADAFLKLASGDTADAKAIADQRRDAFEDDRSQSAAERLTEMADKLDADASASMAVERKQNTARRVRFAAAAERVAGRQKAMAATMRNLASAISEGWTKFLDAVRQKAQVEFLEQAVTTAKDAELRSKYPTYAEQQRHAGEPATSETADFAEFPSYTAMRSDLASLGRQLLEVDGTKKLGQRLMSVADDVTDSFKAWAKEGANLILLKAFSQKGTGKAAEFPTEKAAEDAIARSGYKGRAIPWQIKRGQWTVISSPSEAMQRGVWQGDGDKRITLSPEFGDELVEQIGKTARHGGRVSVPWQFEMTHSRRKALSRMGIETPAEYRSALREFIGLRQTPDAPSKLKELERAMVGRNNDGLDFFPTPAETVDAMIDAAEIESGMRVLEPSAGWGHIAERLASVGASPEVVELSTDRRELLAAKGFNVVGSDFMEFTDANHAERGFTFGDVMEAPDGTRGVLRGSGGMGSGRVALVSDDADGRVLGHFDFTALVGVERRGAGSGYDRILMNPPFSDRRDAAHVQHAYSFLKPGGRLVAIVGEGVFFGKDKKAQAFREWLDSVGGTSEKLAEGTFNDPSLPANTSVNARMVVIEKPGSASEDGGDGVPPGRGQPLIEVDGAPRSVTNALGQRIHPTDEGVRNFWRWFGGSKMVDGQGRPRVFYHGAPRFEGDAFTFKWPGNSESKDQMFWFSDKPAVASSYAFGDDGAQVIPVYIKASNPSTVNAAGRVEEEIFGVANKYFDSYASEAKSNGFDSYVILQANESLTGEDGLSDVVVVFKPNQIKSATGNSGGFDPENKGLIFSRNAYVPPASGEKASLRQIEAFAHSISAKWAGGPAGGVRVIKDTSELPERLRRWVASADADGVAQGFFYPEDESVYLIADRINTVAQAQFVLFHEVYGHHGLRSVLGGEYASTMTMLSRANPKLAAMADGWMALYSDQEVAARVEAGMPADDARRDVILLATEEALSDWAGTAPQINRLKAVVARIQRGLRAIGLGAVADWLEQRTDAEVLDLLSRARRSVERGGKSFSENQAPSGSVFSRPGAIAGISQRDLQNTVADAFGSAGAKMNWWHKTLGTQWHKAQTFPEFRPVFEAVQGFYTGTSRLANEAADQAPHILPKLERARDLFRDGLPGLLRNGIPAADARAIAAPVFEGTLMWRRDDDGQLTRMSESEDVGAAGVVFTDDELREQFKLTDQQIDHYREFRAAVDASLDQAVAADVVRYLGDAATPAMRGMVEDNRQALRNEVTQALERVVFDLAERLNIIQDDLSGLEASGEDDGLGVRITELQAQRRALQPKLQDATEDRDRIAEKYARIDELKAKGYAPLMRFGKFAVNVAGADGQSLFFSLYETRIEANRAAREMREQFANTPGAEVTQGVLSQQQHELFSGVPFEALEMFANELGRKDDAAFQAWLKLAKNNRSALKRLIHRKGVAGFSEDAPRVLASFITSNSRMAAGALHLDGASQAARNIKDGDVKDEAIKLLDAVKNPAEVAPLGRGLLFANFIGGSIASAVVNLTQPITMTLPYLSQWGGGAVASKRLASAGAAVASGRTPEHLKAALKRAEDEGVVSPQEIHHLMAQASGSWRVPGGGAAQAALQKLALLWGGPFSLAEQFNRRVTFLAAYETALAEKMDDPFAFAERTVLETQGLYNKGNSANWARNPLGALALTFKQFSIHYLEWLVRMAKSGPNGRRAALMALALLAAAGGGDGLPFADDIDDLVDTIAQALGYDFGAKRAKREFLADTLGLGDDAADVVLRGLSAIPGVPMDVSLRMGMGNLIPATGLLLQSNTDRSRDVMEVAGAAGGLARQYIDAAQRGLAGDVGGAATMALPVALQNAIKGAGMYSSGEYRDTKDRLVSQVDEIDASMKLVGFQPQEVAQKSRRMGEVQRSIDLARKVEADAVTRIARANIEGKPEDAAAVRRELLLWNSRNPGARISISPSQVARRAREMRMTRDDRFLRSAPKEMRPAVADAIQ